MENKHTNVLILVAFLVFFIFTGIAIYNIKGFNETSIATDTEHIKEYESLAEKENTSINNKINITLPKTSISDKRKLEIQYQKYFFNFIDLIYNEPLDNAYNKLNEEYINTFNVYNEEFNVLYSNLKQYKHFRIIDDFILEDRYIVKVRFLERADNESNYTDKIFTIFNDEGNISCAGRGIISSQKVDISSANENFEISIDRIIHDYEGIFYEMTFLNKTTNQVNIENIYGIKDDWKIKHEIFNSSFIDYELRSMFPRENLVFFKASEDLDSIKVELSNGENLTLKL